MRHESTCRKKSVFFSGYFLFQPFFSVLLMDVLSMIADPNRCGFFIGSDPDPDPFKLDPDFS